MANNQNSSMMSPTSSHSFNSKCRPHHSRESVKTSVKSQSTPFDYDSILVVAPIGFGDVICNELKARSVKCAKFEDVIDGCDESEQDAVDKALFASGFTAILEVKRNAKAVDDQFSSGFVAYSLATDKKLYMAHVQTNSDSYDCLPLDMYWKSQARAVATDLLKGRKWDTQPNKTDS